MCSFYGSRSYDAALPTSDVDRGILLPPSVGVPTFFQKLAHQLASPAAKQASFTKVWIPERGRNVDRLETVYRSFAWDFGCAPQSRANHGGA